MDFDPKASTFLNSFCFGFRLRPDAAVDPTYLAYFFRSSAGRSLVASLAQGATRYNIAKTKPAGIVHAPVGRASFAPEQLAANVATLVDAIQRAKPSGAKGTYMRTLTLAPTMGPGVRVDIPSALAAASA